MSSFQFNELLLKTGDGITKQNSSSSECRHHTKREISLVKLLTCSTQKCFICYNDCHCLEDAINYNFPVFLDIFY
jgi:hypothetical protein